MCSEHSVASRAEKLWFYSRRGQQVFFFFEVSRPAVGRPVPFFRDVQRREYETDRLPPFNLKIQKTNKQTNKQTN
jgi:hypothetical protein